MPPDIPDAKPAARRVLANLWRIRWYVRPYLGQMVWMLAAALVSTGAGIVVPLVIQRVVDGPVRHHRSGGLLALGLLALALGLIEALLIFIRRWTQSSVALGMEYAMRNDLYAHLQRLPLTFHDRWQSGQLLSRSIGDLSTIRRFLSFGLVFFIVNLVTYAVVSLLLLRMYWPLGLLVVLSAIPLFLVSRRFTALYLTASRAMQDELGDLATAVEESAQGIRVIKSFGRGAHVAEQFRVRARKVHDTGVGKARLLGRTWAEFDLVPGTTLAIVLVAGAFAVGAGHITVGGLVAFVSLELMLVWPVDALGWIIANGQEAATAADRIYEVLDVEPSIVDRPGAVAVPAGEVTGRLRFAGVAFTYPGSDTPVLNRIDLDVRPGETVAIVGTTGSGKTSLVSLVPRLYDVSAGQITLDGRDIRDYRLSSLRDAVAVAFEEPILFSMSVRENLTLGHPGATDDDIERALAVAQADFVHDLPWGLATRVGEQGLSLSGGQRQRLALARAVLARPRVLVLDDPLSALDVHTEAKVEQALSQVLRGTTALVVVHRPSTVALADRVALLDGGELVAVGTHSRLMATEPRYRAVLSALADSDGTGDGTGPRGRTGADIQEVRA